MSGKRYDQLMSNLEQTDEKYQAYANELIRLKEQFVELNLKQMQYNEKQIKGFTIWNYTFQTLIIVATASIPVIGFFETSKAATIIVGFIDTVLVSLVNLFRFREHKITLQQTNQKLLQEHNLYITCREPYDTYLRDLIYCSRR